MPPLLEMLASQKPRLFSVKLDGTEIYRGEFTKDGIKTLLDLPVDSEKPRWLMTIFFDNNPTPAYLLSLGGETG